VFSVVVFAVHSWSVRGFLFRVPSLILSESGGGILVVLCYHLAFALFESLIVMAALLLLTAIMPADWLRQGFKYKGMLLVAAGTAAAIILQTSSSYETFVFVPGNDTTLIIKVALLVVTALIAWLMASGSERVRGWLESLTDRLSVMLFAYLPLDVLSLIVVGVRLVRW
jgi:hypothetical protein